MFRRMMIPVALVIAPCWAMTVVEQVECVTKVVTELLGTDSLKKLKLDKNQELKEIVMKNMPCLKDDSTMDWKCWPTKWLARKNVNSKFVENFLSDEWDIMGKCVTGLIPTLVRLT